MDATTEPLLETLRPRDGPEAAAQRSEARRMVREFMARVEHSRLPF